MKLPWRRARLIYSAEVKRKSVRPGLLYRVAERHVHCACSRVQLPDYKRVLSHERVHPAIHLTDQQTREERFMMPSFLGCPR